MKNNKNNKNNNNKVTHIIIYIILIIIIILLLLKNCASNNKKNPKVLSGNVDIFEINCDKETCKVDIPKEDKETLYAVRRLSEWMGDCYVRESSGSGYWANIKVSYNVAYSDVTIPVTLNVTRVEGGM